MAFKLLLKLGYHLLQNKFFNPKQSMSFQIHFWVNHLFHERKNVYQHSIQNKLKPIVIIKQFLHPKHPHISEASNESIEMSKYPFISFVLQNHYFQLNSKNPHAQDHTLTSNLISCLRLCNYPTGHSSKYTEACPNQRVFSLCGRTYTHPTSKLTTISLI